MKRAILLTAQLLACSLAGCSSGRIDGDIIADALLRRDADSERSPFERGESGASEIFFSGYDTPALFGTPPAAPAPVERAIASVVERLGLSICVEVRF